MALWKKKALTTKLKTAMTNTLKTVVARAVSEAVENTKGAAREAWENGIRGGSNARSIETYKRTQGTFEHRKDKGERIRCQYPTRVPVICVKVQNSTIPDLDKQKFLVPEDLSISQFTLVLRRRVRLPPETAMYILVNNSFPAPTTLMSAIYDNGKDDDGFLYVMYSGENTFG